MDTPSSPGVPRLWRPAKPATSGPVPATANRGPRRLLVCFGLTAKLFLLVAIGGMLSWLRPVTSPHFVPIMVTEYESRSIPALPMVQRDRDGLCAGGYFRNSPAPFSARGHFLLRELGELAKVEDRETAVVYVSAHAVLGATGQVYLLPGDAKLDDPATWIALREVLDKLRSCPARSQLLVLDIVKSGRPAEVGNLYRDVAGAIAAELEAVPDPRRLVLSACAPGQVALVSEELGRSVFSYYFEEGLRGYADACSATGRRDRQVTARELAAFVRARVDHWAMRNRAVRQTPVLYGTGADFALVAVEHGRPSEHIAKPEPQEYPDYLRLAWQLRDTLWNQATYRFEPRAFQQIQATLLAAEEAWRGGATAEEFSKHYEPVIREAQSRITREQALFQPRAASLAQEALTSPQGADGINESVRRLMANLQKQLAVGKLEDAERLKATARAEFQYAVKDQTNHALEAAVFAWAVDDATHEPGTLRFLDDILRRRAQPEPHYAETLLLRQLADLTYRVEKKDWPAPLVGRMLRLAQLAEKANADALTFPWTAGMLEQAAQARHHAEVCLWARGYAALSEVERSAQIAEDAYKAVLAQAGLIRHAQATLDEAQALLPFYVAYLETDAAQQEPWEQAARAARELADVLAKPPSWRNKTATTESEARDRIAAVQAIAQRLAGRLDELKKPFAKESISQLKKLSEQAGLSPSVVTKIEAMLSVPALHLGTDERATLWRLARQVARKLNDETTRLDREEDRQQISTAIATPIQADYAKQDENARARRRARAQLALLDLAGVTGKHTESARVAFVQLASDDVSPRAWAAMDKQLRDIWRVDVAGQYEQETAASRRVQMAWLMPPLEACSAIDNAQIAAASLARLRQARAHWSWLGDHFRYLARDYQGLGLAGAGPMAAQAFYTHAAAANEDIARHQPEVYATIQATRPIDILASTRTPVRATLEISRVMPPGHFGPLDVSFILPDNAWLHLSPDAVHLQESPDAAEPRQLSSKLNILIGEKPGAEHSDKSRPAGFLAQALFEGRAYHTLVDVPMQTLLKEVQILVSTDPARPEPALSEILLRPNKTGQPVYVYVQNLTDRVRHVTVHGQMGDGAIHKVDVDLNPGETKRVRFGDAPMPDAGLPEVRGTLVLRATDSKTTKLLDQKQLRVDISSPSTYVRVSDLRFEPDAAGRNKLSLSLQPRGSESGPAVCAELVLPEKRLTGYLGAGGGTLQGELPSTDEAKLTLFADRIGLADGAGGQGPIYVNVDGLERAFQFKATLTRQGPALTFPSETRPTVRWQVAPFVRAGAAIEFPLEVDNAPAGSSLEVSLGRGTPDRFEPDLVSRFAQAKQRRLGFWARGNDGALVFDARVSDWRIGWNTRYVVGQRLLRARLLDAQNNEITRASQYVTIDNDPPSLARLVDVPAKLRRGSLLNLRAEGMDPESGIAQVVFFVGQPRNDRIPSNTPIVAAKPLDASKTNWVADMPVPKDKTGATAVTAQFTNGVGLVRYHTATLEITDTDPNGGLGRLHGKVLEGMRAQPNLDVILRDARGMDLRRATTKADGTFVFEGLEPGSYVIFCVKPDSGRRATVPAVVRPNETTIRNVTLAL